MGTDERLAAGPRLLLVLRQLQPGVLRHLLPRVQLPVEALALLLELVVRLAELGDGLLREQLLQRPLLDVLRLVLLELRDERDSPLEDRALVLLATRDDLGELVDPLVDGLTTPTLDWRRVRLRKHRTSQRERKLAFLVVILAHLVPLLRTDGRLGV
jgi:hypothetical protein